MRIRTSTLAVACCLSLAGASCSGSEDNASSETDATEAAATPTDEGAPGVRLVAADEGLEIQGNPPDDLVILDVRTAEEFAEGHLDGAVMLDFYDLAFASQIADLDPDVPYLLYCRSGNRSGQTAELMEQLGFADVADVDGGILAWADAGLPLVSE